MIEGHGDDAYKYGAIRLNFSSNVYNHVDHEELHRHLYNRMERIHTYPEPAPCSLERKLAEQLHLHPDEVCVTNGATEAIYLIAQAYRGEASSILMPTFSEYADACRLHGHRITSIYQLQDLPDTPRLLWLCNPNNPTGEVRDKAMLVRCIEQHPRTVFVIDQSYEAFTLKPLFSAKEAAAYPNMYLLHSLTKRFAIPGLRIGYVTACADLLHKVRCQRMPWSVNQLAIEAADYLIDPQRESDFDLCRLLQEKERVARCLRDMGGVEVWHSDTHYLLVQLRMGTAAALKEYLATEHGILIRDASNFTGLDERFFRIAIQTAEENDELINRIKEWIYMY